MIREEARTIAEVILEQLGGQGRLVILIGAHKFNFNSNGALMFSFELCDKANRVKIILDESDTYTMVFYKCVQQDCEEVYSLGGLYNDQLISTFEDYTGLFLHF